MARCCRDGAARLGRCRRRGAARRGAGGMGCAALLWGWLLLGCSWGPAPPGVSAAALLTAAYVLDDASGPGRQFDGIGAVSGGGVSGAGGCGGSSGAVVLMPSSGRRLQRTLGWGIPSVGAFGGFGAGPREASAGPGPGGVAEGSRGRWGRGEL